MSSLADLGVKKNWTYETIITCFNDDIPHAAPFGIKSPDMKTIQIEMYKGSHTLAIILNTKEFVINLANDPAYYFYSLYERDKIRFSEAKNVKAPFITECPAFLEARMRASIGKIKSYIIEAEIIKINIKNIPRLFNRAEALVIESLITATRIGYYPDGKAEEILKENYRVVKKVAPDSSFLDIMDRLFNEMCIFIK